MSRFPSAIAPAIRLLLACAGATALALPALASAEEQRLVLMFQNDLFAGSDGGGYTNGIAVSHLRSPSAGEQSVASHWLLGPVAPLLGVGPAALTVTSLNQIMVTPADIARSIPDPADAPYLGALWLRAAQVSVRDDVADMLAVNLGMIGPASGARQSQIFIHRITGSTRPQGWDYQVRNRPLVAVERYRALRFATGTDDTRPAADFIMLGGAALGNWQSSAGTSLMLRYGTGLQRSYPTAMRQTLRTGDPGLLGRGWFVYTGVHADRMFSQMGIGSNRPVQGSTAELRETQVVAFAGIAYGWNDGALTFSLQNSSSLTTVTGRRKGYGSLSYTGRWQ